MKPSPAAIAALKRVMTKEQRQLFVDNCIKRHGINLENVLKNTQSIDNPANYYTALRYAPNSFSWCDSEQGFKYWENVFNKLKYKEKVLKLFIK